MSADHRLVVDHQDSDHAASPPVAPIGTYAGSEVAADRRLARSELTPRRASLEEAYMELTRDAVDYQEASR
ncbi:hypothetical protein GCM10020369_14140 [Cryptosporangium minutisporangium]|uniref:Uncharacterized protein n=1 Tax=Cryptosporangium minutisporangium TaxID=113569 RepID=A0ABP6SSF7_9ACTN